MDYKLTIFPAVEAGNPFASYVFETKEEMYAAKNTCADLLIFMQDKAKVMDDYSNMLICEQKIGMDWVEIDEDTQ